MHELRPPESVIDDPDAREVLRVWVKGNGNSQGFTSRPEVWTDPAAWGLLLVDLARHIAQGYCRNGGDPAVVLCRIKAGLDAEWSTPTDPSTMKA